MAKAKLKADPGPPLQRVADLSRRLLRDHWALTPEEAVHCIDEIECDLSNVRAIYDEDDGGSGR